MNLFGPEKSKNIIPHSGEAYYYGPILNVEEGSNYYNDLINDIAWEHDKLMMFGKQIVTKRKVAWYGDKPYEYTYSRSTKLALPWSPSLSELKLRIENISGETYNSCLLNLYHSGEEGMSWHSDNEKELKKNGAIASMSLGAERKFAFKHKETKETVYVNLEHTSLLIMGGEIQSHWLHRLPPTKKVDTPRVNLTFRTIEYSE